LKSVCLRAILVPLLFTTGCASEGTQTKSTDDGALAAANQVRAEAEQALKTGQEAQLAAKQASDKAGLMYQRTLRK
jgi:outer membrane lipoprotein-sorting protein